MAASVWPPTSFSTDDPRTRAPAVELLAPRGRLVGAPRALWFRSELAPARLRLLLSRADGKRVIDRCVDAGARRTIPLSAAERSALRSGVEYVATVDLLGTTGELLTCSEEVRFTLLSP